MLNLMDETYWLENDQRAHIRWKRRIGRQMLVLGVGLLLLVACVIIGRFELGAVAGMIFVMAGMGGLGLLLCGILELKRVRGIANRLACRQAVCSGMGERHESAHRSSI
jgi:hypothetical protein